jgi:lipopolysaccharide export system permease protein
MGPIFYRYLIREQLIPLGVCFFGLCVILVTGRMMQLMQILFGSSVTVLDLFELILLTMPKLVLFALPMATLVGILMGFLRLTSDSELLVMRTSGIKFSQFLAPVLSVVLVMTGISLFSAIYIMPHTNTLFRLKLNSIGRAALPALLNERTFINFVPGMIFYFQNVDPAQLTLQGIFVDDAREPKVQSTVVAEHGQIVYQQDQDLLVIKIMNGVITRVHEDFKNAQTVAFREYELPLRLDELSRTAGGRPRGRSEMTLTELWQATRAKENLATREDRRFSMEMHQMLALPVGCLALGLLAPPLGSRFRQANRMLGVMVGLCLFLGYYLVLSAGKGLAEHGHLAPSLAIWAPNLLALALAVVLWIQAQRERPMLLLSMLTKWFRQRVESRRDQNKVHPGL